MQTHSSEELRAYAAGFIARQTLSAEGATVIALSGDLGAGKTTFAQGVAKALGVSEQIASPTFVIEKLYELRGQRWQKLIHIDAYRLNGDTDLAVLHWDELVRDSGNLILIEWPERVSAAIPKSAIRMHFDIDGDGRIITSNGSEESSKT